MVLAHGIETESEYLGVSRKGRGKGLHRKSRQKLWQIFSAYRSNLLSIGLREPEDTMHEMAKRLEEQPCRYRSVIVDEAQDLPAAAMRLVRAIAPRGDSNNLMIVGDAHQRIFGRPLVLSHCGINIQGRSRRLRVNYRTPEEVRECAVGVLEGVPYDDLDGSCDTVKGYTSLMHGEDPVINHYNSFQEEVDGILEYITELRCGDEWHRICLVARSNDLVSQYKGALMMRSVPTFSIKSSRPDNLAKPGIRIGTMHRVKGLEFDHVIAASVTDEHLPSRKHMKAAAGAAGRAEFLRKERSLLYVVCTRARKTLLISSYDTPSPLIADLRRNIA